MSVRDALLQEAPASKIPESRTHGRFILWIVLVVLLLAVLLIAPSIGSTRIDMFKAIGLTPVEGNNIDQVILLKTRLPRVLYALVAGGGLALAGAVYQAILRNDLAEPFSLGVASGSALGALIAFQFLPVYTTFWAMPVFAFAGASLAVGTIYLIASSKGSMASPTTLLLAGVTMNFFFGAAILLIQYLSDPYQTVMLMRWLMGSIDVADFRFVVIAAVVLCITSAVILGLARQIDILSLGEHTAHHLGVNVGRVRFLSIAAASVLVGTLVAFAGPVGFVGLVVPHILRRLLGAGHRALLPACLLGGASFLAICDTVARTALFPTEIPVGILTAFLGAPFFLWLLMRQR